MQKRTRSYNISTKHHNPYEKYYITQAGTGISNVYRGTTYQLGNGLYTTFRGSPYQRGHGVGSFLGGLFKLALPYLKRGLASFGKEALSAGVNVIDDITLHNKPFKESFMGRADELVDNMKNQGKEKIKQFLSGGGYNRYMRKRKAYSSRKSRKVKTRKIALKNRSTRRGVKRKRSVKPKSSKKRKCSTRSKFDIFQ